MSTEPIPTEAQADAAAQRASERRNFFLMTSLTTPEHGIVTAKVRNLSAGGMMIEFTEAPDPDLAKGQRLTADLRNIGRVRGEIAWTAGRRFGVKFDREIDPEAARKPVSAGGGTPDYAKPIIVPDRSFKLGAGTYRR